MLSLRRSLLRRYRIYAPHMFRRGWPLLLLLLVCDGITALCFPQIQAALLLNTPGVVQNTAIMVPTIAPMNNEMTVANDTFQRADRNDWGTSSGGQTWLSDAQTATNFQISNNVGIVGGSASHTYQNAILGPSETNAEISFTGSLSHYDGTSILGGVLHWSDANDLYRAYLDGQNLVMQREMGGMVMTLTTVPYPAQDGALYTFRFRTEGAQLCVMVWPSDQPPPAEWQIAISDSALSSGHAGISVLARNGVQAQITAFTEVTL